MNSNDLPNIFFEVKSNSSFSISDIKSTIEKLNRYITDYDKDSIGVIITYLRDKEIGRFEKYFDESNRNIFWHNIQETNSLDNFLENVMESNSIVN